MTCIVVDGIVIIGAMVVLLSVYIQLLSWQVKLHILQTFRLF